MLRKKLTKMDSRWMRSQPVHASSLSVRSAGRLGAYVALSAAKSEG